MQHILAVSGMVVALAVIGTFLIMYGRTDTANSKLAAGGAAPVVSMTAVPFTEVARGTRSQVTQRTNYLITSSVELESLWKLLNATTTPPEVDFTKDSVIAVFAGQQPTTGYAISVAKVQDASARVVSVTITRPGTACMTGQTLTTPYDIVIVPTTPLPLTHRDIPATKGCP